MGELNDYFVDKSIDAIFENSYLGLEQLLENNLGNSTNSFLTQYKLNDYHWKSYRKTSRESI